MSEEKVKERWVEKTVFQPMAIPNILYMVAYIFIGVSFVLAGTYALARLEMNIIFFIALTIVCMKSGLSYIIKGINEIWTIWKVTMVLDNKEELVKEVEGDVE